MEIKDIYEEFKLKIKGPFYKTFIISWLIVNWRIIFVAFGENDSDEKIIQITNYLSSSWNALWLPLLISLFLFVVYRWVEVGAEWYVNLINRLKKRQKIKSEESNYFTGIEYAKKLDDIDSLNSISLKHRNELADRKSEIEKLYEHIKFLSMDNLNKTKWLEKESNYNSARTLEGEWKFKYKERDQIEFVIIYINLKLNNLDNLQAKQLLNKENNPMFRSEYPNDSKVIFETHIIKQVERKILIMGEDHTSDENSIFGHNLFKMDIDIVDIDDKGQPLKLKGYIKGNFRDSFYLLVELTKID